MVDCCSTSCYHLTYPVSVDRTPMKQPYYVVTTAEDAQQICEYLAGESLLALDAETYPNGQTGPKAYYDPKKAEKKLWISDPYLNNVRLIQIRARDSEAYIFDLQQLDADGFKHLLDLLASPTVTWLGHNLKFDYRMIAVNLGVRLCKVWDTMLAAICMGYATGDNAFWSRGAGLKDVTRDLLDLHMDKTEQASNWGARVLTEQQLQYAADDLLHLFDLHDVMAETIETEFGMTGGVQLEFDVMPVVADIEMNGIHFDPVMYAAVQEAAKAYIPALEEKLCRFIDWPMMPVPPLVRLKTGRVLQPKPSSFEDGGKSPLDSQPFMLKALKAKGIPCENLKGDHLESLADFYPILSDFGQYKDLSKQLSMSYLDWVHPVTGKIHSEFNQSGASTGRFTSNNPNLQQVPKMDIEVPEALIEKFKAVIAPYFDSKKGKYLLNYRYCFIAPEDWEMASADYSGQEICVMVALSGDQNLISVLWQPELCEDPSQPGSGIMIPNMKADLHAMTAELMWGKTHGVTCWTAKKMEFPGMPGKKFRDIAKSIVFGNAYGKTGAGLAADWGIPLEEAEDIIELFFKPYPTLKKWLVGRGEYADKTRMAHYGVPETGIVRLRMVNSDRHTDRGALKRAGMNTPIQGTSALMMKLALVHLRRELAGTGAEMCGTVHDEVLVRYPQANRDQVRAGINAGMKAGSNMFLRDVVPDKWSIGTGRTWCK